MRINRMYVKRSLLGLAVLFFLLGVNQIVYLTKVQFTCTEKINRGEDLNSYEVFSAMQTHTMLALFGWFVEPNTARACMMKQFHLNDFFWHPKIPVDDQVLKAQQKLLQGKTKKVRLAWPKYTSDASIYLNGSTISLWTDSDHDITHFFYEVPLDYKPGIIKIHGITLCETVFDYLENTGHLSVFVEKRIGDEVTK